MATSQSNSSLIGLGVLAVGGYLFYKKVLKPNVIVPAQIKQYATRLRVNMPTAKFKGDDITFDVYVGNPNNYPLTIKAVVGDVFLVSQAKRYKLGNVRKYGDVIIKPTAETKFTFTVRTRFLGLLPYFTDMVEGKIKNQVLTFSGTININGAPYPITESLRIS